MRRKSFWNVLRHSPVAVEPCTAIVVDFEHGAVRSADEIAMSDAIPTTIDPRVRRKIAKSIVDLENAEKVRVLYACESGSRAWGFPSRDSDYDVWEFHTGAPLNDRQCLILNKRRRRNVE